MQQRTVIGMDIGGTSTRGLRADGPRDYTHFFAHIVGDVEAADLALVSQETLLGGEALGLSGYPSFNGPQEVGDAEVAGVMLLAGRQRPVLPCSGFGRCVG